MVHDSTFNGGSVPKYLAAQICHFDRFLWINFPQERDLGHHPVAHQRVGFADPQSGHRLDTHGAIVGFWCRCRRGWDPRNWCFQKKSYARWSWQITAAILVPIEAKHGNFCWCFKEVRSPKVRKLDCERAWCFCAPHLVVFPTIWNTPPPL